MESPSLSEGKEHIWAIVSLVSALAHVLQAWKT